jgi:hypothetical protein
MAVQNQNVFGDMLFTGEDFDGSWLFYISFVIYIKLALCVYVLFTLLAACILPVSCSAYSLILKMAVVYLPEMLADFY